MKSLQQCVDQMNQLLDELIQVATRLRDVSLQVISEEELIPLQKQQEQLLSRLEKIDHYMKENYRGQLDVKMREHIHRQLQDFQQLNQEFMQHLSASHGIIQFELHRLREEEDFSTLSRLNKILPSFDSSEAIESEEEEKS